VLIVILGNPDFNEVLTPLKIDNYNFLFLIDTVCLIYLCFKRSQQDAIKNHTLEQIEKYQAYFSKSILGIISLWKVNQGQSQRFAGNTMTNIMSQSVTCGILL
jgi:hypothetical protein